MAQSPIEAHTAAPEGPKAATPAVVVGPTLVRTIANLAFDRNEETPPFAGGRGEFVTLLGGRLRWRLCRPRRLGLGTRLAP